MKKILFSALKHADFKKMWLSQVFSQIALNMLTFTLVLHIFDLTRRATSISLVMLASAIPVALIGPFSGVLADRIDYRKIMIYTNFLRFLVALLLLLADTNVLALLEIIFLMSAISQIFTPAESSSVPLLVPEEKLVSANSLVMITTYATLLVGYTIAGPLMNLIGTFWLYIFCAILYLIATWFTSQLSNYDSKVAKTLSIENLAKGIDQVWDEAIAGFNYIRSKKEILSPMIKLTVGWTVLGALITLLPSYGSEVLNINPRFIGPVIIGPAGIGMIIAAFSLTKRIKLNHSREINWGFFIVGISLLLFAGYYFYQHFYFSKALIILLVVIMGFGSSMIQISAQTLLHINSDEKKRGRVFGISSMQLRLATCLPALVVAAVSDLTSPLITMILLAVTVFIYSLILVFE